MSATSAISKIRGSSKYMPYPQPEGVLGESMLKYSKELGDDSPFGNALSEVGEAMKQLADIKYALEDNVKQNFLEPLHQLQSKELKEVMHHRKKLQGRRLDYDCKRRKKAHGSHVTDDDLKTAEEKFEESWNLAEAAMINLLDNDVEQISQLAALAQAQLDYYRQSADVLEGLVGVLDQKLDETKNRPRREPTLHVVPKTISMSSNSSDIWNNTDKDTNRAKSPSSLFADNAWPGDDNMSAWPVDNTASTQSSRFTPTKAPSPTPTRPCCEGLYDFEPENEGELGFSEGDIVMLTERIDENWFEGTLNGKTGFFPVNYVRVIVDVPPNANFANY